MGLPAFLRGGFRGHSRSSASLLEEEDAEGRQQSARLPPELAMYEKTTTMPVPIGPNPYLFWVEALPSPLPTTPAPYEQCFGCQCLIAEPGDFLKGGLIADAYTCNAPGGIAKRVPEVSWMGQPGSHLSGKDCPGCQSFALTVEDLDYPGGIGETGNEIKGIFWAMNIPGDWSELTEAKALSSTTGSGDPEVLLGKVGRKDGLGGLSPICPEKGEHRYKITLWALSAYAGNDADPVDPSASFSTVMGMIESMELARVTFFGNSKAPGGYRP